MELDDSLYCVFYGFQNGAAEAGILSVELKEDKLFLFTIKSLKFKKW